MFFPKEKNYDDINEVRTAITAILEQYSDNPAYWTKKELFWRTLRLLDKKGAIRHPMMRNSPL